MMDLESVFNGGKPGKGESLSVWQAEIALRLSFLRKVYGILTAQLLLTVLVCAVCMFVPALKDVVQSSVVLSIGLLIGTLVVLVALIIKKNEAPTNFILLFVFTLLEGLSVGIVITYYDVDLVLKAFAITASVFIGLTAYTMQSKYDFSSWGASLFAFLWVLIIGGVLQIFFWSEALDFVLTVGGALIFCGFIIFDTHMIMHKVSTEEYIMASINLYLDFINLFLYILRLLQAMKKN
ncbi:protein lifeguard 4-like [Halichondria panicea]|uniref:protein lifeguard 4-like n=1 Tax=Halichondria panicea TaxID=6063 RepID=UPI00312B8772